MQTPHVFYSNRLEVLFGQLKYDLFQGSNPFTKRMVIVSSPAIKSWLMLQIAQDPQIGVFAGIEVCFVDPALNFLSTTLSAHTRKDDDHLLNEPSELEIAFHLELEITKVIQNFATCLIAEKEIWGPLLSYLKVDVEKVIVSKRTTKRITALSKHLAKYFLGYGIYGRKLIEKWNDSLVKDWQQALWCRLENSFKEWNYPSRKFASTVLTYSQKSDELQVHLFGLSYFASVHHEFLMKVAQHLPVSYYLLSPCQKFWTDLVSNKEGVRLKAYWQKRGVSEAQHDNLDNYLRNNNPLLANFGKLGREMSRQIEESEFITFEKYALPEAILEKTCYSDLLDEEPYLYPQSHPLTLLEAVQSDIALLRNPDETEPLNFEEYDGTIQVHAAPKPMREVESIYNAIMGILDKHRNDDAAIVPSDVIVMAPNIQEYVPFIHSVFGAQGSQLDYRIMDLEISANDHFIQGFLHLLQLPSCRWDAASLLKLFEYKTFQKKQRLTREDVQTLHKWIKGSGIRWGKDREHRNSLLERDHCDKHMFEDQGNGTWEYGLGRLLEGLVLYFDEKSLSKTIYSPVGRMESTQGELLGRMIHLLQSLLEDLKPLHDGTTLTLKEWSLYLKCLCDTYFSKDISEEEQWAYQELITQIEAFEKVSFQLKEAVFTFQSIHTQLIEALHKKNVNHRESHLHAIRFCSLLPMRSIPAQVIVLMGMNDGDFPRGDESAKLNYLLCNPDADYYPSRTDFDRYLFLEAILSTRRYLLMSYISQAKGDSNEQSPSLLVTELLDYLDKAFQSPTGKLSEQCLIKHALLPFEKRYFDKSYSYRSYIKTHYADALSYYTPEKQIAHRFMSDFSLKLPLDTALEIGLNKEIVVDLSQLRAFAANPLKTYFNQSLRIYLEKEADRELSCDEELQVSHLNAAMIAREALFSDVSERLSRAKKTGELPAGPFKKIGEDKIREETDFFITNLKMHKVDLDSVFSLEFSERFLEPHCNGNCWELPPLILTTPKKIPIKLIGRIENISSKGLIVFGEDKLKDAVKIWPTFLSLCCLITTHQLPINMSMLFIKSSGGKTKQAAFDNPEYLLGKYIDYYFEGKNFASPLLPEWIPSILNGNASELQTIMNKDGNDPFQPIYDDYLKWMGRNAANMDASTTIESWQEKAKDLFIDLSTTWYPVKQKAVQGANDEL